MKTLSIKAKSEYLSKKACLEEADRIIKAGKIQGMSRKSLAKEIFFHAIVNDFCMRTGMFRWIRKHADPIDLRDGGDRAIMRALFNIAWRRRR